MAAGDSHPAPPSDGGTSRRTTMKKKLMALAAGVAAFVMLTGFGPGAGCGRSADPQERFARVQEKVTSKLNSELDTLKATPDQRAKILAIKDRLMQRAAAQVEQKARNGQAERQWVIDQLTSDAPDKAALHAKVDTKADEFKGIAHEGVDALVEVNGILNPEQRAQLKTRIQEMQARGGGWGPPGMGF